MQSVNESGNSLIFCQFASSFMTAYLAVYLLNKFVPFVFDIRIIFRTKHNKYVSI